VYFDSVYCDNFNFQIAEEYIKAGYDLDEVHYRIFVENYSNFFSNVLEAVKYDFYVVVQD